jgi:hypothetical protein
VKHTEGYREFVERVGSTVEYKVDVAALEFVDELVRAMRLAAVNQAELARRLAASEPYVSKVLRGDTNFTLGTMVKLATAVQSEIRVHLAPAGSTVYWHDLIKAPQAEVAWPQIAKPRKHAETKASPGGVDADALVAA